MGIEHRPEHHPQSEPPDEYQASFAAALNNLNEVEAINTVNRYKSFTVASICREDLRGILTDEEITRLCDGDMENISNRMSDAYRDSGGYWESLEIMARFVLDKEELEDTTEEGHTL